MCKKLTDWIKVQRPGPFSLNANQPTSNVFIADFIELKNFQFCRTVIALNDKIFNESTIKSESNPISDNENSDVKDLNEQQQQQQDDKSDNESNYTPTSIPCCWFFLLELNVSRLIPVGPNVFQLNDFCSLWILSKKIMSIATILFYNSVISLLYCIS